MSLKDLDATAIDEAEGSYQKPRYREMLVGGGLAARSDDPAFVTFNGRGIRPHELKAYLQRLRAVRINMTFNSTLCRGLLGARYQEHGRDADQACGGTCASACSKGAAAPASMRKSPVPV
jgi:hypothetical protein